MVKGVGKERLPHSKEEGEEPLDEKGSGINRGL